MITIRNYAMKHGCTVQNIYKHIRANQEQLEGHVIKQGSKQFLDEFAQQLLDQLITPKEVIQVADETLLNEINKLRAQLVAEMQKNNKLTEEKADLFEQLTLQKSNLLALENDRERLEIKKQHFQELAETEYNLRTKAEDEIDQVKTELSKYKKTWFGLYKKVE